MNRLLIMLSIWLAPSLASASATINPPSGNAWTLYTFGNGAVIWDILNAIKGMVSDPSYGTLLTVLAVFGFFLLAIRAGYQSKEIPKIFIYIVSIYLILYSIDTLKVNIEVNDPVTGYSNVATDVPAAVGLPAAFISQVGHWLTEKTEQYYSVAGFPSELTLSGGGGFNLATSLVRDASQAKVTEPYLQQSLTRYMNDCVLPMLVNGTVSSSSLINSNDLWATVASTNAATMTEYYAPGTGAFSLKTCRDAYQTLTSDLAAHAPEMLKGTAGAWNADKSLGFLSSAMDSAFLWLSDGGFSGSAAQATQQAAVIHVFQDSFEQAAAATGNNELLTAVSVAQAKQAQKSSWFAGAEIFKELMGYVYSVLQAFTFAIVPVVIIALFIPGMGMAVLKNYGQIMVWMVLWGVLLGLVNYLVAAYAKQGMSQSLSHYSGISMSNMPMLTEQTSNFIMAAGFLATMVPMVAWGLVKGGIAFTQFIGSAGGQAFASGAANNMASGNMTLDNQSSNNSSLGQQNLSHKPSLGYDMPIASVSGAGGMQNINGGGISYSANGGRENPSVTRKMDGSHSTGSGQRGSQSETYAKANEHAQSVMAQKRSEISNMFRHSQGTSESHAGGTSQAMDETATRSHGVDAMAQLARSSSTKDFSRGIMKLSGALAGAMANYAMQEDKDLKTATEDEKKGWLAQAVDSVKETAGKVADGWNNASTMEKIGIGLGAAAGLAAMVTGAGAIGAAALGLGRAGIAAFGAMRGAAAAGGSAAAMGEVFASNMARNGIAGSVGNMTVGQIGTAAGTAAMTVAGMAVGKVAKAAGGGAETGKSAEVSDDTRTAQGLASKLEHAQKALISNTMNDGFSTNEGYDAAVTGLRASGITEVNGQALKESSQIMKTAAQEYVDQHSATQSETLTMARQLGGELATQRLMEEGQHGTNFSLSALGGIDGSQYADAANRNANLALDAQAAVASLTGHPAPTSGAEGDVARLAGQVGQGMAAQTQAMENARGNAEAGDAVTAAKQEISQKGDELQKNIGDQYNTAWNKARPLTGEEPQSPYPAGNDPMDIINNPSQNPGNRGGSIGRPNFGGSQDPGEPGSGDSGSDAQTPASSVKN